MSGCWVKSPLLSAWHFDGVLVVFGKTTEFLANVKNELKRVTWPSRKETYGSTGVVIGLVLAVAVFLWIVDSALSALIRVLLS
jgi:preprotein translocase subunit SecE